MKRKHVLAGLGNGSFSKSQNKSCMRLKHRENTISIYLVRVRVHSLAKQSQIYQSEFPLSTERNQLNRFLQRC